MISALPVLVAVTVRLERLKRDVLFVMEWEPKHAIIVMVMEWSGASPVLVLGEL